MPPQRLGCGEYAVLVHARDDLSRAVAQIPFTSLEWGRALDETSQARVRAGAGCCGELVAAGVRPWSHQLGIYRSVTGGPGRRVWSGPVVEIDDEAELALHARDLSAWLERRFVHDEQIHASADLADIFEAFWLDAMDPDPVPDFTLTIAPTGVDGDREVLAEQYRVAGEEMRELGRTGLDWTVLDRVMLAGPEEISTPPIATLIDRHFAGRPAVRIDGMTQANRVVVSGAGGGAEGEEVTGEASAAPGPEGLLEVHVSEPSILDDGSALDAAQTRLDRSSVPQVWARGGRLLEGAPVAMDRLVPGARVQVALDGTCLPVRAIQRLESVSVQVAPGSESVEIALQPLGTLSP